MKIIHLSDLHLGKRVNEFSMIKDQEYILDRIVDIIDAENADTVIIAGDIYDKTVPPAEAVALFDDFLYKLSLRELKVFIISGNHDSAERIAFGSRLMNKSGVHVSPVFDGKISPVKINMDNVDINVYMIPFVKPAHVRAFFPEAEIEDYTDAMRTVVENMDINENAFNLLIAHQFVTGASRCESEDMVGGTGNVDVSVFDAFDYVALGHLHGPQNVGKECIRYCGTPLKYSFSEANHKKTVTVLDIKAKDDFCINTVPLIPMRDMKEIKGKYEELVSREFYKQLNTDDYYHITLTDEEDILDVIAKLRIIYPNLMKIDYDNVRTRQNIMVGSTSSLEEKTPLMLFEELYQNQNNKPMTDTQKKFTETLIDEIWRDR